MTYEDAAIVLNCIERSLFCRTELEALDVAIELLEEQESEEDGED